MQIYKGLQDVLTLAAQRREEKEAAENQAFDVGMKYTRLKKSYARQKEIHEQIREANVSILKDIEIKRAMASEANTRAEAAEKRVSDMEKQTVELQRQNADLQEKNSELLREVTRLKDQQSDCQGELCQTVVTKLFQTQGFGKWFLKATTGVANIGRNVVLEELMEAHPELQLKKVNWDGIRIPQLEPTSTSRSCRKTFQLFPYWSI